MRFCADAGHAGSRLLQAAAASPPHETALLLRLSGPSHRTLIAAARLLLEATSSHESSRTEPVEAIVSPNCEWARASGRYTVSCLQLARCFDCPVDPASARAQGSGCVLWFVGGGVGTYGVTGFLLISVYISDSLCLS